MLFTKPDKTGRESEEGRTSRAFRKVGTFFYLGIDAPEIRVPFLEKRETWGTLVF